MFLGIKINCGGGLVEYPTLSPILDTNVTEIREFLATITAKTGVVFFYNYNNFDKKVYFGSESDCLVVWDFSDGVGSSICYDTPQITGCTDVTATNYDPTATVNNGTCIYPLPALRYCIGVNPNMAGQDVEALLGSLFVAGSVVNTNVSYHCNFATFSFESREPTATVLAYYNDIFTNPNYKIKSNFCTQFIDLSNRCQVRDRLRPEYTILGFTYFDQNGIVQVVNLPNAIPPQNYMILNDFMNLSGLGMFTAVWDQNNQEINISSETYQKMYQLLIFDGNQPTYLNFNC